MAKLQEIIANAIGTGTIAYGLAIAYQSLGEQTLTEAAKDQQSFYAAGIATVAVALYGTLDRIISGQRNS